MCEIFVRARHHLAVDLDETLLDIFVSLTARAQTGIGHELVETNLLVRIGNRHFVFYAAGTRSETAASLRHAILVLTRIGFLKALLTVVVIATLTVVVIAALTVVVIMITVIVVTALIVAVILWTGLIAARILTLGSVCHTSFSRALRLAFKLRIGHRTWLVVVVTVIIVVVTVIASLIVAVTVVTISSLTVIVVGSGLIRTVVTIGVIGSLMTLLRIRLMVSLLCVEVVFEIFGTV